MKIFYSKTFEKKFATYQKKLQVKIFEADLRGDIYK